MFQLTSHPQLRTAKWGTSRGDNARQILEAAKVSLFCSTLHHSALGALISLCHQSQTVNNGA